MVPWALDQFMGFNHTSVYATLCGGNRNVLHSKLIPVLASAGLMISVCPAWSQDGIPLVIVASDGVEHTLHLEQLDAMEQISFETSTIWTEAAAVFSGVAVRHILDVLDIEGETLLLTALNDYAVDMPVGELSEDAPIVATRIDGEVLPVREKGPYWVIYPFDTMPEYNTEVNYSRSVWQLKSLSVPE